MTDQAVAPPQAPPEGAPRHVDAEPSEALRVVRESMNFLQIAAKNGPPPTRAPHHAAVEIAQSFSRATLDPNELLLPENDGAVDGSLFEALQARRSRREFSREPIEFADLARVLRGAVGVSAMGREAYGIGHFPFRTYPTPGGLQSVDLAIYVRAVAGMDPGLYWLRPGVPSLSLHARVDVRWRLAKISPQAEWAWDAAFTVALVANLNKLYWKYGDASYRLAHLEAGAILANLSLVSTVHGWSGCPLATIDEEEILADLRLPGATHVVTCAMPIGNPR